MIPPCPNCGKNNFKKTRDRDKHLDPNRARPCLPRNLPVPIQNIIPASTSIQNTPLPENLTPIGDLISFDKNIPTYYPNVSNVLVVDFLTSNIPDSKIQSNREQKGKTFLTIDELIKWLTKPGIKNNKKIRSKPIPKTEKEWFDLMESNNNETSNSDPQAYHFLDLDIEVPWPVSFLDNKEHCEVWQNGIQYAKDIFKVDGAEYAFSTWFTEIEKLNFEARMTEEVKFIRDDTVISVEKTKKGFKIIDKYEPIRESKKAGGKYVRGGPNVILTKKTKPGFWVGIDEKFLVREVSEQSEVGRLDSNAVVYGLY
ncbi:hypothetical protein F8M41_007716 [Gigaspora margarita]|uniref:Uncharacterized protein n=1 Tax=Gigaspora margarita TaxID=4874 RepID=A0A8H3X4I2_GIGMA|nr:hypothetical protein F8M41_007716 [Gigaspora margarita]